MICLRTCGFILLAFELNNVEKPRHGGQPIKRKGFCSPCNFHALSLISGSLKFHGFPVSASTCVRSKTKPALKLTLPANAVTRGGENTVCHMYPELDMLNSNLRKQTYVHALIINDGFIDVCITHSIGLYRSIRRILTDGLNNSILLWWHWRLCFTINI